jgi:hypothetical protein
MDGINFSIMKLNSFCWTLGTVSGVLEADVEGLFFISIIKVI